MNAGRVRPPVASLGGMNLGDLMRKRLIAASVVATLAISLVGGATLAAPREFSENEFTFVEVQPHDFCHDSFSNGTFSMGGDLYGSPANTWMGIGFDLRPTGVETIICAIDRTEDVTVDDDGVSHIEVKWEGAPDPSSVNCPYGHLKITATWSYGTTHQERSTTKYGDWLCKEVSQVDNNAEVSLTVLADGEPVIDGDFGPVGTYKTVEQRCHSTGKRG
jgi:hypothetical protein